MRSKTLQASLIAAFMLGTFAGTPGFADKPDWAGGKGAGKPGHGNERPDQRRADSSGRDPATGFRFSDRHRSASRDYFHQHYSATRCPPGLAKKNNGCMPPGLARKWSMGQPLPREVIFHDLPPELVDQFGTPPSGYRYVRVDSDILLIELGTRIVLDVIESLGW
jgi:Ni/Co efflux regulator RcnB